MPVKFDASWNLINRLRVTREHLKEFIYEQGLTWIPAWMSNNIHFSMRDEITYPFPSFNGATDGVCESIS